MFFFADEEEEEQKKTNVPKAPTRRNARLIDPRVPVPGFTPQKKGAKNRKKK